MSQGAIVSSREAEHEAEHEAKHEAKIAKINALNEIKFNGWKNQKRLKKYFDDYYKNTFYLSSNFCNLYRTAEFKIDALIKKLESTKCKTKGFLAEIKQAVQRHKDILEGNCGALTKDCKKLRKNISKANKNISKANKNQINVIEADLKRANAEMYPNLVRSILQKLINVSDGSKGTPINYPYTQGDAAILSILRVTGVDKLDAGWGDRFLPGLQKKYDDANDANDTPTHMYEKLEKILRQNPAEYKCEIEKHAEVLNESSKKLLKNYKLAELNDDEAMFISRIYLLTCMVWFRNPRMFKTGADCFVKLNKNGDIKKYWLSLYEKSIELLTPSKKEYLMKLLKAPDKK